MKFLLSEGGKDLQQVTDEKNGIYIPIDKIGPFFKERGGINNYSPDAAEKGNFFEEWIVVKLERLAIDFGHWFIDVLPDLLGYITIGSGIAIIISAIAGKGVIKPLAYWFISFIIAALILGA
jgi:hypothetical protein